MRAVGHYIIIDELPEEIKKTTGGLLLNDKTREDIRYRKGVIISLGPSIDFLEVGETIMFDKAAGHKTDVLDVEYRVITVRDVVAVV